MHSPNGDQTSASGVPAGIVPAFTRVRLREGYDPRQVDLFIGRTLAAIASMEPVMRPADVRAARFRPVRVREGYDMAEVDSYLDDLEQRLAQRHPDVAPPPEAPRSSLRALLGSGSAREWSERLTWTLLVVVLLLWLLTQTPVLHLR